MRGGLFLRVMRAMIVALLLPLAFSSAMPTLARVVRGAATHVCHCEARGGHSTCACAICHADRSDLVFSEESIRGRCGDDDVAFGGVLGTAIVAPATIVAGAPLVGRIASRAPPSARADLPLQPDVPPPRSIAA